MIRCLLLAVDAAVITVGVATGTPHTILIGAVAAGFTLLSMAMARRPHGPA